MQWDVFDLACPTRALLDRIGDKWTVLIVSALGDGPLRFGELKRAIGSPAPKVLTAVLRSLEHDGILNRRVYTASPLRVEYSLTPLGRSLFTAVGYLRRWAERNMTEVVKARSRHEANQQSDAEERVASGRSRRIPPRRGARRGFD